MDIGLFFLGALGALLTVYLSKQEVIPEFRPMYDTSDKEIEALEHRDHIKKTENHIDELQTKLSNNSLKADFAQQLTTVLNTSLSELNAERLRQQSLEHEIKIGQVLSRGIGFVLYIVLGGVFGAFLAGRIQVEGLSGDLPDIFASIVIGATWTSYLSTIGLQTGQKKADERIQAGLIKSLEKINAVKKDIAETLAQEVTQAEKAEKVEHPLQADAVARIVAEKLDQTTLEIQKDLNITRKIVQKDFREMF